jgi:hypothetical protein
VLVTTVIASAVVPTLIAQRFFEPARAEPTPATPAGGPFPARESPAA